MNMHTHDAGRALPLILVALAIAALAFFLVADPFGSGPLEGDGQAGDGDAASLLDAEGEGQAGAAAAPQKAAGLGGVYGAGAMGAIRLRLLWVGERNPLVGQSVRLLSRRGEEVAATPSDPTGAVLFSQVRPAKGYMLNIKGEGFSEVLLRGVTVHSQSTTDVGDIVLGKGVVLRGRVVDGNGRPVPGSSVSVHTVQRRLDGMLTFLAEQAGSIPVPLKEVASDAEGYFAFAALGDGKYSLVARHGGYASKHEADVIVARQRGAGVLTLVLGTGGLVTGKVEDEEGKPIANAQVVAIRDAGRMMRMGNAFQREVTVTAEDGSYVIDTLGVGLRYRFGIIAEGYAPMYETQGIEITEKDLERDFILARGGNLEGLVTDEQTGKPIEGATVAVFVGRMGMGRSSGNSDQRASADIRRTDKDGRFRFEAITPGPVGSAVIRASGHVTTTISQWLPGGATWPDVVAGETQQVEIALKSGGTISGSVVTKADKTPIQGAEVVVMQKGWAAMMGMWAGYPSAVSGPEGSFEIVGVPAGSYVLHTQAVGFSAVGGSAGVEIEVPASGGTVEKTLQMTSAGNISGVVLDPEGEPIGSVRIRVREDRGGGGGMRGNRRGGNMARNMLNAGRRPVDLSDDKGNFRLEGLETDTMFVVYGESDEYVTGESKPFKLAAGQTKQIKLTMLPGGSLRGRVLDESGQWLAGARVQVGRLAPEDLRGGRLNAWRADRSLDPRVYVTDEEGQFLATNIKPGRILVKASKEGYITFYKRNLTLEPGQAVENYSVPLSRGEVIEGTVRGADGRPLRGAMVAVTKSPDRGNEGEAETETEASEDVEPALFARTDDGGRYKVENIAPGTYSVVIWFAAGHKGWSRDQDKAAIHRNVPIPGREIDFKLTKSEIDPNRRMGGNSGR